MPTIYFFILIKSIMLITPSSFTSPGWMIRSGSVTVTVKVVETPVSVVAVTVTVPAATA